MNHRAKKSLGQNFLIDHNYQRKIVTAVRAHCHGEDVIEIGPGQGALTDRLLDLPSRILLIEKDGRLVALLKEKYQHHHHVRVIHEDILKVNLGEYCDEKRKSIVVGNLPYNISSQILINLFKENRFFKSLFLMFQREVAIRCLADKGGKDYGMLALWVQLFSRAHKLFDLPPNAFSPRPKVVSSFLKFDCLERDHEGVKGFINFARVLFSQRRKKVMTILKRGATEGGIKITSDPHVLSLLDKRPEQLSLEELILVYNPSMPFNFPCVSSA